jgi:hypothetical protein
MEAAATGPYIRERIVSKCERNRKLTAAVEGGHMKRLLACLLIIVGFVLAGCEEEEHDHAHAYRYPEYRGHPEYRGYPEHRGYRLKDETLRNDGIVQDKAAVEQQ